MAVNWGVIGAGGIASRRTIPEGITKARNSRLVAVMDADATKSKEVGTKYKVKYYTKEDELIKDKDVQVVYIATPVHLHHGQTIKVANAGKHILCEKPLALTLKECEEMIKTCKKNKIKLGLGFMMRFHAHHKKAKEMIKAGLLGKIVLGRAQLSCLYPEIKGAWRQDPKLSGGGSFIDMGNHCIDLLEFLFDSKVKEVACFTDRLVHDYKVEDSAICIMRFENGAQGIVDNFFNIPDASSKNRLEIYGSKGSLLAEGTIGQSAYGDMVANIEKEGKGYDAKQKRTTATSEKVEVQPINMYSGEIEHFSECIERDLEPTISGEDGLWSQKVVLASYKSARTGKVVRLKD